MDAVDELGGLVFGRYNHCYVALTTGRLRPRSQERQMPSASLLIWQTERIPRIAEFEKQCATASALAMPNRQLEDENHRGLIMLLSAHFQGFCRDLYTECALTLSARIMNTSIKILFQQQFTAGRRLDSGHGSNRPFFG